MTTPGTELAEAYASAHYIVLLGWTPLLRRIGLIDEDADRRLRAEAGVTRDWSILTPCNPHSSRLSDDDNQRRLKRLHDRLTRCGMRWTETVNRDPGGRWPDEPGVLIGDAGLDTARALAISLDQYAFVFAALGNRPELVWVT